MLMKICNSLTRTPLFLIAVSILLLFFVSSAEAQRGMYIPDSIASNFYKEVEMRQAY